MIGSKVSDAHSRYEWRRGVQDEHSRMAVKVDLRYYTCPASVNGLFVYVLLLYSEMDIACWSRWYWDAIGAGKSQLSDDLIACICTLHLVRKKVSIPYVGWPLTTRHGLLP